MVIYLCYSYSPNTTAVYLERALRVNHEVYYIGPGFGSKPGYPANVDLRELAAQGLPAPDLVLFSEPGVSFFPRGLEAMDCPTACYLIDVHQGLRGRELYTPFFDFVFVAQRDYVEHFQKRTPALVKWLPLAYDPEIHGVQVLEEGKSGLETNGGSSAAKRFDVGFIGHANSETRLRRLQLLEQEFSLNNWRRHYRKEQIAGLYSQSKIVFNTSVNGDLNMRVFEAMASGSLLLTDAIGNGLSDIFQDGVHLALYNSDAEMLAQVRKYLGDEALRSKVASAGRAEVLARHTYSYRCVQVLNTVFGAHTGEETPHADAVSKRAPIRRASVSATRIAYAQVYAMQRQIDPILSELENSWQHPRSRWQILAAVAKALGRRINSIVPFSPGARAQAQARRHLSTDKNVSGLLTSAASESGSDIKKGDREQR